MKRLVSRNGRIFGGYVPSGILEGIKTWVAQSPERDQSMFLREAAREKLRRDGISFEEKHQQEQAA